ncbi:MAG TPA: aldo/keto reductase [Solirubrobacterales bacterium]
MEAVGERTGRRLGFGCAGLMQSPSRRHRQRLLAEAFEHGVRHFDVARMYGLGAVEGEVGRFARGRRERIAIVTKFGIEPTGSVGRLAALQAPARAVLARFPSLRAVLRRRESAFNQPRRYDAATARRSLETSLRELGTDHVDAFLIHGAGPGDAIDIDELAEALEDLRRAGSVRAWGIASEAQASAGLLDGIDPHPVIQVRDDVFEPFRPPAPEWPVITFGVLSAALPRICGCLAQSGPHEEWSRAVGEDCGRPEEISSLLLRGALLRNPRGTVLFSTTRPERIALATEAEDLAREADPAPVLAFERLARAIPDEEVAASA